MTRDIYRRMVNHKTWDEKDRELCWQDPKYYDMCHGPYAISHRRRLIFERRLDVVERMLLKVYRGDLHALVGKKVLDVGAGVGSMAMALGLWGARVTALDQSQAFTEISNNKLSWLGGGGACSTSFDLPFEDGSFDLILSTNFLDTGTMSDPQRKLTLAEMKRVLKPGCHMIHTIRNASNPYIRRSGRDPVGREAIQDLHYDLELELIEMKAYSSPSPWPGLKNVLIDLAQALPVDTFKVGVYIISRKRK